VYLFVLSLFQQDRVCGVRLAREAPLLTDMLFADDLILMGKATVQEVLQFSHVLDFFLQCVWLEGGSSEV
jgi:hypothetical protein